MKGEFTAVYEKRGKWYVAYIEEIPGVNTQGKTLKEILKQQNIYSSTPYRDKRFSC